MLSIILLVGSLALLLSQVQCQDFSFPYKESPIFSGTLIQNGRSRVQCRSLPADSATQSLNFIHAIRNINESGTDGPKFNFLAVGIAGDGVVNTTSTYLRISVGRGRRREFLSYGQYLFQQTKYAVGTVTGSVDPDKLNGRTDDKVATVLVRVSLPTKSFVNPFTNQITNFTIGNYFVEIMVRDLKDAYERSCIRIENAFTVRPEPVFANISAQSAQAYTTVYGSYNLPFQSFDTITLDITSDDHNVNFSHAHSDQFLRTFQNISVEADLVRLDSWNSPLVPPMNVSQEEIDELCPIGKVFKIPVTLVDRKRARFVMPYCPQAGVWNLTYRFPDDIHEIQKTMYVLNRRTQPNQLIVTKNYLKSTPYGYDHLVNQTMSGLKFFIEQNIPEEFRAIYAPVLTPYYVDFFPYYLNSMIEDDSYLHTILHDLESRLDPETINTYVAYALNDLSWTYSTISWYYAGLYDGPIDIYSISHPSSASADGASSSPLRAPKSHAEFLQRFPETETAAESITSTSGADKVTERKELKQHAKEFKKRPASFSATVKAAATQQKTRKGAEPKIKQQNWQDNLIDNPLFCDFNQWWSTNGHIINLNYHVQKTLNASQPLKYGLSGFYYNHLTIPKRHQLSPIEQAVVDEIHVREFVQHSFLTILLEYEALLVKVLQTSYSSCFTYCYPYPYSMEIPFAAKDVQATCNQPLLLQNTLKQKIQTINFYDDSCFWSYDTYTPLYFFTSIVEGLNFTQENNYLLTLSSSSKSVGAMNSIVYTYQDILAPSPFNMQTGYVYLGAHMVTAFFASDYDYSANWIKDYSTFEWTPTDCTFSPGVKSFNMSAYIGYDLNHAGNVLVEVDVTKN